MIFEKSASFWLCLFQSILSHSDLEWENCLENRRNEVANVVVQSSSSSDDRFGEEDFK